MEIKALENIDAPGRTLEQCLADLKPFGFIDSSWHNDAIQQSIHCASLGWRVWIDEPDPADRDWPNSPRFSLSQYDEQFEHRYDIAASNDWREILAAVIAEFRKAYQVEAAARRSVDQLQRMVWSVEGPPAFVAESLISLARECAGAEYGSLEHEAADRAFWEYIERTGMDLGDDWEQAIHKATDLECIELAIERLVGWGEPSP